MERAKITGEVQIASATFAKLKKEVSNISELKKKIEEFLAASVTELVEIILIGAICLDASDIHIEPEETEAKFRIRIDGVLHDVMNLNPKTYKSILSRIKLLSGLKLNVTDRPQDGRFTISISRATAKGREEDLSSSISRSLEPETPDSKENQGYSKNIRSSPPFAALEYTIEIRASALPAEYGESIVLRLLNPKSLIEIEALGLRKDLTEIFKQEIKRPNGMIIVTGPTGSGKTTSLYAVLKRINKPEIKIITIEDPVEYHLGGLSQTQVDPSKSYTFASGLRSIMRQDPDVILVGEIRDLETAEIACQAALTGHLVFSTLHTNDAAGAIARLVDLGVKPISIAPALNMVVAQRLPRKVCKKCAKSVPASPDDLKKIKKGLAGVKKEILPPSFFQARPTIPQIKGCEFCSFTGYKGRIGIFETFLVDDQMEKFILTLPSIVAMKELAIKKGMVQMNQDGLIKVLEGTTTLEEIERVAGE
jgi:type II secretory ATPase GspE/PulE/Tfp pilus assembly ATPase PilB-like protein